jgi:hypothetical protein
MEVKELLEELDSVRLTNKDRLKEICDTLVELGEYPAFNKSGRYAAWEMVFYYGPSWNKFRGKLCCPHCSADLRDHEAGAPFKREIGISDRDRVVSFRCPDCGQSWPRDGGNK